MADATQKPLYWCLTKAMIASGDQLQYGVNWLASRRAILRLYGDHLQCRDWRIDYSAIVEATLYTISTAYVLKVETAEKTYHFGLRKNAFWRGELPFPVQRETAKMSYSVFSIIARVLVIAYLLYFAWDRWIR